MADDRHPAAAPDPDWTIGYDDYDRDDEMRREAILALGNGVLVTRGAHPATRQDGRHYPGTYHAGCYDRAANDIAGERDITESLVNLPNWLPLVCGPAGGDPWHPDDLDIRECRQRLDMHGAVLHREIVAQDSDGRRMRMVEDRLVSMADPRLCALRLCLTPLNFSGDVECQATLDAGVLNAGVRRFEDYEQRHLRVESVSIPEPGISVLTLCTRDGRTELACAQRVSCDDDQSNGENVRGANYAGRLVRVRATMGKTICFEKVAALCSSLDPSHANVTQAALEAVRTAPGFDALQRAHARSWQQLWSRVAIDAQRTDVLRALRFHAFHILQTVSPHTAGLDAGLPARGWSEAYHGHIFWDELFVLPFFNYRFPEIARASLLYRHRRLDAARAAARAAGLHGAMYPWRSASGGEEVAPRHQKNLLNGEWMRDHTWRQRHIASAVAFNVWQYWLASGDDAFMQDCGAEMLLDIARFWAGIAQPDGDRYCIRGVIGPDEYHNAYPWREEAGLDNNAYTNMMAAWTLCRARELLDMLPEEAVSRLRSRMDIDDGELALWDRVSRRLKICFHDDGVISQFEGFERLQPFDPGQLPEALAGERTDWALRAIGRSPDEFQVTKQTDVLALFYLLGKDGVLHLLHTLGYNCTEEDLLRTARYYLPRTAHRSSLSRVMYSGALASLDPALSWDLWKHALETDLNPLKGESVKEGIHLGAMGGTIDILQRCYFGIRAEPGGLRVAPVLPPELGAITLDMTYRDRRFRAEARGGKVHIRASDANAGTLVLLDGERSLSLGPGESASFPS